MKIICIGRNYAAHAKELKNAVPEQPLVFMKPATALLVQGKDFYYPDFTEDLHYEAELVLRIGKHGRHIQPEFALDHIDAVALGIDFTARDVQQRCKENGHPWEIAKGFDHSAPISEFVALDRIPDFKNVRFNLTKNGDEVQYGQTKNLLFDFTALLVYVSRYFKLLQGDYIFTGTPAGVGPVERGDQLRGNLLTTEGWQELLRCNVK